MPCLFFHRDQYPQFCHAGPVDLPARLQRCGASVVVGSPARDLGGSSCRRGSSGRRGPAPGPRAAPEQRASGRKVDRSQAALSCITSLVLGGVQSLTSGPRDLPLRPPVLIRSASPGSSCARGGVQQGENLARAGHRRTQFREARGFSTNGRGPFEERSACRQQPSHPPRRQQRPPEVTRVCDQNQQATREHVHHAWWPGHPDGEPLSWRRWQASQHGPASTSLEFSLTE